MSERITKLDAAVGRMDRRGAARHGEEMRLASVVASGLAPKECGPEMVAIAPARGRVVPFRDPQTYLNADGDVETVDHGAHARLAMRRGDVFDLMIDQAAKRKKVLGLTSAQIQMGRDYRDLVERHASAGVRCSSIEGMPGGGGGGAGGFMDAVLDQGRQIDRWRSLVGDGLAMDVRRVRPSKRGERIAIKARVLVDMVCLEELVINEVLKRHGWAGGENIAKLTCALAVCLDSMAGPVRPQRSQSATFGAQSMADSGFEPVRRNNGEIVAGRYQPVQKGD